MYIFVDVVKRGVLTLVSETQHCRNDRYYDYYYLKQHGVEACT